MRTMAQQTRTANDAKTQAARIPDATQNPGRRRITRWAKGVWTGLMAGSVAIILEMVLFPGTGRGGFWDPVRLSASIALGNRAIATSTPITFDIFFVGMLIHYIVAIWYAVVLGMIIRSLSPPIAVLTGAAYGSAIYLLNFYGLSGLYPWVSHDRNWIFFVGHLAFGMAAGWLYNQLHLGQFSRRLREQSIS